MQRLLVFPIRVGGVEKSDLNTFDVIAIARTFYQLGPILNFARFKFKLVLSQ